jgi:hypothetical protein
MRRAIAALLALAVVAVVFGFAYRKVKRDREEEASPMFAARASRKMLDKRVRVDPLPLSTFVDARFMCRPQFPDWIVSCSGADWVIHWRLQRETNTDSIPRIIAGTRTPQRAGEVTIAGFQGFVDVSVLRQELVTAVAFVGFRDDPHGRLKLTIDARGWRGEDNSFVDVPLVIAIMESTEVDARGIPARLPEQQDMDDFRAAADGFALMQEQVADWRGGLAQYANARDRASQRASVALADYFADMTPEVAALATRRIREHAPNADGYTTSVGVAEAYTLLDRDKARAEADDLARAIVGTWTFDQADASAWAETELRLMRLRSHLVTDKNDTTPSDDLARRFAPMDYGVVLRDPRSSLDHLARAKRGPEAEKLYAAWLEPDKLPKTTRWARVASHVADAFDDTPVARRHMVAMLSRREPAGTLEDALKQLALHGNGSDTFYVYDAPKDAHGVVRICDIYAAASKRLMHDADFTPWASVTERDAQIAVIRAALDARTKPSP